MELNRVHSSIYPISSAHGQRPSAPPQLPETPATYIVPNSLEDLPDNRHLLAKSGNRAVQILGQALQRVEDAFMGGDINDVQHAARCADIRRAVESLSGLRDFDEPLFQKMGLAQMTRENNSLDPDDYVAIMKDVDMQLDGERGVVKSKARRDQERLDAQRRFCERMPSMPNVRDVIKALPHASTSGVKPVASRNSEAFGSPQQRDCMDSLEIGQMINQLIQTGLTYDQVKSAIPNHNHATWASGNAPFPARIAIKSRPSFTRENELFDLTHQHLLNDLEPQTRALELKRDQHLSPLLWGPEHEADKNSVEAERRVAGRRGLHVTSDRRSHQSLTTATQSIAEYERKGRRDALRRSLDMANQQTIAMVRAHVNLVRHGASGNALNGGSRAYPGLLDEARKNVASRKVGILDAIALNGLSHIEDILDVSAYWAKTVPQFDLSEQECELLELLRDIG